MLMSFSFYLCVGGGYGRTGLREKIAFRILQRLRPGDGHEPPPNGRPLSFFQSKRPAAARSSLTGKAGWKILYVGLDAAGIGPRYVFRRAAGAERRCAQSFVRNDKDE